MAASCMDFRPSAPTHESLEPHSQRPSTVQPLPVGPGAPAPWRRPEARVRGPQAPDLVPPAPGFGPGVRPRAPAPKPGLGAPPALAPSTNPRFPAPGPNARPPDPGPPDPGPEDRAPGPGLGPKPGAGDRARAQGPSPAGLGTRPRLCKLSERVGVKGEAPESLHSGNAILSAKTTM